MSMGSGEDCCEGVVTGHLPTTLLSGALVQAARNPKRLNADKFINHDDLHTSKLDKLCHIFYASINWFVRHHT